MGAVLLAVATGLAEGAAAPLLDEDEDQPTTTVFVQQCDMLVNQFDEIDFPNDRWPGAPSPEQRNLNRWWNALLENAGLEARRFHASPHTAATLLLDSGVPLEVVAAILGHATLAVTSDIYAKVTDNAKRRALVNLDRALAASERGVERPQSCGGRSDRSGRHEDHLRRGRPVVTSPMAGGHPSLGSERVRRIAGRRTIEELVSVVQFTPEQT